VCREDSVKLRLNPLFDGVKEEMEP
jgi:hypothetical protein